MLGPAIIASLSSSIWTFKRTLISQLKSCPSGVAHGEICFEPLIGEPLSLCYKETGKFETSSGMTFDITSQYIYSSSTTLDVDVHFALLSNDGDVWSKGGHFVSLDFILQKDENTEKDEKDEDNNTRIAKAEHFCPKDNYNAIYKFAFNKEQVEGIENDTRFSEQDTNGKFLLVIDSPCKLSQLV